MGSALQELDLKIHYHPGTLTGCADALYRAPLEIATTNNEKKMVAAVETSQLLAKNGNLADEQRQDQSLPLSSIGETILRILSTSIWYKRPSINTY